MRELLYKIKQLAEGRMLNPHRYMLRIKYDAMLIVIYIRRILESPLAAIDGHRNDAVVLAGGMIHTACITFIFTAQQAFRITGLFCQLRCSNSLGILLRLGQVDGNVQIAVFGRKKDITLLELQLKQLTHLPPKKLYKTPRRLQKNFKYHFIRWMLQIFLKKKSLIILKILTNQE